MTRPNRKARQKVDEMIGRDIPNIFLAAANDDVKALEAAIPHYGVNAQDENLMTPLHHAAVNMSYRVIDRLKKEPDLDGTIVDRFDRNASTAALQTLGIQGVTVAEQLRPICYPETFQAIEDRLSNRLE